MSVLLIVIGAAILAVTLTDIFMTTLTSRGAGFVTGRLMEAVWRAALRVHRRRSSHRLLANMGPLLTASLLLVWVLALWAGWSFVFNAGPIAVVDTDSGQPADTWSRIYYAGFTLFTLGIGDYQPNGAVWQILTAICVANGLLIITLSVTYLVPIVSAATRKRQLASCIASLGLSPAEIVENGYAHGSFDRLTAQLSTLSSMISEQAQQHLAYPALHYFHSAEPEIALAQRLATLDEAVRLLKSGVDADLRPADIELLPVAGSLSVYLESLASAWISPAEEEPPVPSLEPLREKGIPVASAEELKAAFGEESERRRMLLALVRHDGWDWPA